MKSLILLLSLFLSLTSMAGTIKKWTDENGIVHYGDQKAAKNIKGTQTLNIDETFDEKSYEEGVERHEEVKEFGDEMEKERIKEEKRKAEEERLNRPPPMVNRTTVINPSLSYGTRYRYPSYRPGNGLGPVQLPAISH